MDPMEEVTTRQTKKRKFSGTKAVPKAIKQYVQRAITRNEEMKFFDTPIGNTASSVSYYGQDCLLIPQGVTRNNRIGDDIRVHKVEFMLETRPGDSFNLCRLLIATNPTATPGSTTSLIAALRRPPTDDVQLWLDRNQVPRFDAASTAEIPVQARLVRKVNWLVRYLSATTQNPSNRLLYLQLHSDSAIAPHPGIEGFCRVWFTDA